MVSCGLLYKAGTGIDCDAGWTAGWAMDGKETPAAGADNATGVGAWANGTFK